MDPDIGDLGRRQVGAEPLKHVRMPVLVPDMKRGGAVYDSQFNLLQPATGAGKASGDSAEIKAASMSPALLASFIGASAEQMFL